jgi:hypothetical protein
VYETVTSKTVAGQQRLDHEWILQVPSPGGVLFHIEGFQATTSTGNPIAFSFSWNGGFFYDSYEPLLLSSSDPNFDTTVTIPNLGPGTLTVHVHDSYTPAGSPREAVTIDQMFLRIYP